MKDYDTDPIEQAETAQMLTEELVNIGTQEHPIYVSSDAKPFSTSSNGGYIDFNSCVCNPSCRTGHIDGDKQLILCTTCNLTIIAITEDFTLDELNQLMRKGKI